MNTKSNEKIRLFALIEPLNLKMSLCFPADTLVAEIHHFVDDIMRKYNVKYKVGRVDWNGAWILPQYRIGDFFEDKTEITIYSIEYGLTLTSLSSERDRLHVNHSVFYQDLNNNFLKKKLKRDKKKSLTGNVSRTTEVNDPSELDVTPADKIKADNNIEETSQKTVQTSGNIVPNTVNGVKDAKDKPNHNKVLKDKPRPDGHRGEKQENPNKNKGKSENTQTNTLNPKQIVNQSKIKPQQQQQQQQQQNKQNVSYDSSVEENEHDNSDRNDDRTNAKHKPSVDSDTDSFDQEDLKFSNKKIPPHTSAKNR